MAEKIFGAQSNYGWGLTLNMTGKAPAVSKRIFDTLADAQAFADNFNDSAIEGLLLSVVSDGNNNGVYFVKSIKTSADGDAAVLEKLSTTAGASGDLSNALAALDFSDPNAADDKFAYKVTQTDGQIAVEHKSFADAVIEQDADGKSVTFSDKFSAIDTAIDEAKSAAIAAGTKFKLADGESHLILDSVTGENEAITYTLKSDDVASAKDLNDLEALVGTADDESSAETVFGYIAKAAKAAANAQTAADNVATDLATETTNRTKAISDEINNRNLAIANLKTELSGTNLTDDDAKTIKALNERIDTVSAKSYNLVKIENDLPANVKELFKLINEKEEQVGATIQIYKDSALQSATLGKATVNDLELDCLILTYLDVNGDTLVVNIPVGDFLREAEFKDGLEVKNGEVSVKIDSASEKDSKGVDFLSVSEAGVKVSGIKDEIDSKISSKLSDLDADITSTNGTHVNVQVVQVDGKVTEVKVSEDDIASAQALSDLSALVGTADDTKDKATAFGKAAEAKAAAEAASTAAGNSLADAKTYTNEELAKLAAEKTAASGKYISSIKQVNGLITEIGETALPTYTLATGSVNGTVAFNGKDVDVAGLKSAAYHADTDFDASGSAKAAENAAKAYTDEALTWYEG